MATGNLVSETGLDLQQTAGFVITGAPPLGYHPEERALGGRGGRVEVVAVEAEAGLEPQRVARAQTDGHHVRIL